MNRLINVPVDLSEEQTNAINQYQVKLASQPWLFEKDIEIYEDYQNAFRLLEGHAILIPYAAALIDMVNPRHIKSRRDLNKVLWLIEASALVHQYQRPVLELDDKKYVIATFQDLMNAFLICERGFKRNF